MLLIPGSTRNRERVHGSYNAMLGTILLVVLIIALLGGFRDWGRGPFYGTGYYGDVGARELRRVQARAEW